MDSLENQNDYGVAVAFSMSCMTPTLSAGASSISSRRGSVASFGSSFSTSTYQTDQSSPVSSTSIAREFQIPPIKSAHSPLGEVFGSHAYLCTLSASSVGANFGCGELDTTFADLPTAWGCANFDQEANLLCQSFGAIAGEVRADFPNLHGIDQNTPPTILPSQTLKSPNPPTSALATPFVTPVKTSPQPSPYNSPYFSQTPNPLSFGHPAELDLAGPYVTRDSCTFTRNVLSDDSLSMPDNELIDSFKRAASRKRSRIEDDSDDEEDESDRMVPKISVDVADDVKGWRVKPHPCGICEKGFDRHEHLTRHIKTESHRKMLVDRGFSAGPAPKEFRCPFCAKGFTRSDNLKPHIRTHMHNDDHNHKNQAVSLEESRSKGLEKIDPRFDQGSEVKKGPSKKARTKKRG